MMKKTATAQAAGAAGRSLPDEMNVTNLRALKALSNPLRLAILEAMGGQPRTVKQIAAALSQPQTKLYRHIRMLVTNGLVRVTGSRLVSGIEERQYQAAARTFAVDRRLLPRATSAEEDRLEVLLSSVLDATRAEIRKAMRDGAIEIAQKPPGERALLAMRAHLRLTREQAAGLQRRLMGTVLQLAQCGKEDAGRAKTGKAAACRPGRDQHLYAVSLAFYPVSKP
jgi:DNA-binding transcriptional ArsR family regulator